MKNAMLYPHLSGLLQHMLATSATRAGKLWKIGLKTAHVQNLTPRC